jgi:hypothetical protein
MRLNSGAIQLVGGGSAALTRGNAARPSLARFRGTLTGHWGARRIIDSAAFMLAVAVAAYARYGFDASWYAAVSLAAIVYLLPPFILSRVWAKMHGDDLP